MKALLTVDQLSQYLHKSVANIRSDATRNPRSLPPICRLPGIKRLLWRAEHVEGATPPQRLPVALDGHKPRRVRPTKLEQLARQCQLQASVTGRGVSSSARA